MTTTQELIARMRGFGIFGEANALLREGAASIESLSAEVERLESDVLEQAAFVVEHINDGCLGAPDGPEEIAAAIRALIKEVK